MTKRSIEAMLDFLSPVTLVPGMGPKRVEALNESGIETIGDLLYHFPVKYIDRSTIIPLSEIRKYIGRFCTVRGTIERIRLEPGRKARLRAHVVDESGSIELVWFQGLQYYRNSLKSGQLVIISGTVSLYGRIQIVHPLIETVSSNEDHVTPFIPCYSISTEMREVGIQQRVFQKAIDWVLSRIKHFPRVLPERIEMKYKFPSLEECIRSIHYPITSAGVQRYRQRIIYEEMYRTAITLHWNRKKLLLPGRVMQCGSLGEQFRRVLPFKLTPDQERVIAVLQADSSSAFRMHRLLQGDVGSGKTLVAFYSCLPALNSGFQVAWLSPTEVLAQQTFATLSGWMSKLGFTVVFLSGGTSVTERKILLEDLLSGKLHCVVGTHALLQPTVNFKALGMIVIDEQHKFGVEQRRILLEKDTSADFLLMSATPIPQSLVQTIYGDLESVEIRKGPAGRIPVSTHLVPQRKRSDMERFVVEQIRGGARVFYVVPRIENDADGDDDIPVMDVETVFKKCTKGSFSSVSVGYIHGKMSSSEKTSVMSQFVSGKIELLVATSLIEVGIDVPEATVIIIENADYFGLAQLHQLRGRVGRGSMKSWCFLLSTAEEGSDAFNRLSSFSKNHDGFAIAEMDLHFRGPGQMRGSQQSGWSDHTMATIMENPALFKEIQHDIEDVLSASTIEKNHAIF